MSCLIGRETEIEHMANDSRRIKSIFWSEGEIHVGRMEVTSIVAYKEPGQMGMVTWFAVYEGDVLTARYNGALLEGLTYFEPEDVSEEEGKE